MNPTYMVHPDHGTHVVYNMLELEKCKERGWRLSDNQPDGGLLPDGVEPKKRGRPKKS